MALVAAKCTNCGANIEVDDSKELGVCRFCNTAFYVEKVINNYQTNNYITNYQTITKNIIHEEQDVDAILLSADTFYELGEINKAESLYKKAIDLEPYNYLGWMGMVYLLTSHYTDLDASSLYLSYYEKAIKVAEEPDRTNLINEYNAYHAKLLARHGKGFGQESTENGENHVFARALLLLVFLIVMATLLLISIV